MTPPQQAKQFLGAPIGVTADAPSGGASEPLVHIYASNIKVGDATLSEVEIALWATDARLLIAQIEAAIANPEPPVFRG